MLLLPLEGFSNVTVEQTPKSNQSVNLQKPRGRAAGRRDHSAEALKPEHRGSQWLGCRVRNSK